jgi:hypothetical protein
MKIHKLRFTDKEQYLELTKPLRMPPYTTTDEEGNEVDLPIDNLKWDSRIKAIAIPFETGIIPNPIQYDEEGNVLAQTFKEGYHVDVMVTEVIQEWKDYTITGEHTWAHNFGMGEVVKAEDFE